MRLDLHQRVRQLVRRTVLAVVARIEARDGRAFHDGRVVGIRDDGAARMRAMRRADHREQALVLRHAVDDPVGIEDLVPAMLGVRLREHRELDVGRIAAQRAKARVEVLDLVGRQRQTEFDVGRFERARPSREQRDGRERPRRDVREQPRGIRRRRRTPPRSSGRARAAAAPRDRRRQADAPSRLVTRYTMPRSMRATAVRPQLCAMSVAFDDQGEIVPGRGTTSSRVPVAGVSLGRFGTVRQQALERGALATQRAAGGARRNASTSRRCRRCGGRNALGRDFAAAWRGGTARAPAGPPTREFRASRWGSA